MGRRESDMEKGFYWPKGRVSEVEANRFYTCTLIPMHTHKDMLTSTHYAHTHTSVQTYHAHTHPLYTYTVMYTNMC